MSKRLTLEQGITLAGELGFKLYPHKFGNGSEANLGGVLPSLVDVARLAIMLCEYDGTVIPNGGLRTPEAAKQNAANNTGIVDSRHLIQADGYGHAIDCIALTPGSGIDWTNLSAFKAMAEAVKVAAAILNVPIRQGCDWNMNGEFGESREYDWAHFENPKRKYMAAAVAELQRYRRALGIDSLETQGSDTLAACECPECGAQLRLSVA